MSDLTTKTCFCATPIGAEGSPVRRRSDQVLKFLVRAALEPLGYQVVRADELPRPGLITSQIIEYLSSADLVVADLSGGNANVFYELAIRHVTRKPFVQLIAADESLPFDVGTLRTIPFDIRDLDSVDRAKTDLAKQAKYLEEHPEIETPLTHSLQLQAVEAIDDPTTKLVLDLANSVAEIAAELRAPRPRSLYSSAPAASSFVINTGRVVYDPADFVTVGSIVPAAAASEVVRTAFTAMSGVSLDGSDQAAIEDGDPLERGNPPTE
jgi:hypothetical protein